MNDGGQINRRLLIAGGLSATAGLSGAAAFAQQPAPTAVVTGDCEDEPGIKMLFDWRAGKPVYSSLTEAMPQIDWEPVQHPSLLLPYLIPPGWTAIPGWCDSLTNDGMPNWVAEPPQVPWLTLSRIVSPDEDAAFEYVVGNIQGQPLSTAQCAAVAQQSVLGPKPELRSICSIDNQFDPLAPSWFTADRYDQSVLITAGTALGLPDFYLPATTVTFQNIFAPRKDLEELMYEVFLRILYQFLGGGGSDPTPTPTAGF